MDRLNVWNELRLTGLLVLGVAMVFAPLEATQNVTLWAWLVIGALIANVVATVGERDSAPGDPPAWMIDTWKFWRGLCSVRLCVWCLLALAAGFPLATGGRITMQCILIVLAAVAIPWEAGRLYRWRRRGQPL